MKLSILAAALLGSCGIAQAAAPSEAEKSPTNEAGKQATPAKKKMKMKAKKPMQMDAPMKTPMAKPGMMMGDVKQSAEQKQAGMKDMMMAEEKKMPPMAPPGTAAKP